MVAKYRNNGESCIAANNVWVHESIWDDFVGAFVERSGHMTVGDPAAGDVDLGPVRTEAAAQRLRRLVEEADEEGAEIFESSAPTPSGGFYVSPTVCLNPQASGSLWEEEIFGPVAAIRVFVDFDEVVEDTNRSEYGLAGYIISEDENQALRLAGRLEIGIAGVNVPSPNTPQIPFGGVKASGHGGYEGGRVGLEPFIEYQSVALG